MRAHRVVFPVGAAARAIAVLCATVAASCTPQALRTPNPGSSTDIVVTDSQIAQLNVRTAWDVVKRKAPQLSYREDAAGQPTQVWRHGRGSIYLSENPLLFVDGVRVTDIRALDEIPAAQVRGIRIMTGLSATTHYGTNAEGGAIVVETKRGR